MLKCILLNENVWIPIEISLKFVPKGSINNNPALLQIMAWRRLGDKPLSESMMVSSLTHICVTRPQWVKLNCQFILPICYCLVVTFGIVHRARQHNCEIFPNDLTTEIDVMYKQDFRRLKFRTISDIASDPWSWHPPVASLKSKWTVYAYMFVKLTHLCSENRYRSWCLGIGVL